MANPQHIEWLKEGVEAWNARRARDDFVPDLSKLNFNRAFRLPTKKTIHQWQIELSGVNLQGANLVDSRFYKANLENANMFGSDIRGASFIESNMKKVDLRFTLLQKTVLHKTDLRNANVETVGGLWSDNNHLESKSVDLRNAQSLDEVQVNSLRGDFKTIPPTGMQMPSSWQSVRHIQNDFEPLRRGRVKSVFLSYGRTDFEEINSIYDALTRLFLLKVWWDQNIKVGQTWRNEIAKQLEISGAVITFWTEISVSSQAVIEEASTAQTAGKLIQVRLAPVTLPYGFGETQYLDLFDWDGDPNDPRFQRLVTDINAMIENGPNPNPSPKPAPKDAQFVKAAKADIDVTESGVDAKPAAFAQIGTQADPANLPARIATLIKTARHIANSQANMGADLRATFCDYADDLETTIPPNAETLQFFARAISREVHDEFNADMFSRATRGRMDDFLSLHTLTITTFAPDAAEAFAVKEGTQLSDEVTADDVKDVLDALDTSIRDTEAATENTLRFLDEWRDYQKELEALQSRVTNKRDQEKVDALVKAEVKELGAITARAYHNAKDVVARYRDPAGDAAIVATLTGVNVPQVAQFLVTRLTPIMKKLGELLTVLPPL